MRGFSAQRNVVITGGARGIGRATAQRFLATAGMGDFRVILCDIDESAGAEASGSLDCPFRRLDVTDAAAFGRMIEEIEETYGPVDVLVNNAGIMSLGPFLEQSLEMDRRQIEVNFLGVLHGIRAVLPRMLARGSGHIVNVASMAGRIGVPFASTYSATKAAVVGLTEAIRLEVADSGVQFSYVLPVPVNSELMSGAGAMVWPPNIEIEDVAEAIVDGVRRGQVAIYVPKLQRAPVVFSNLVPRRLYDMAAHLSGLTRIFRSIDGEQRRTYSERIHQGVEDGGSQP